MVHALALILSPTDTPTGKLLFGQQTSFQFLGAVLRASTLRGKVRTVKKFMAWLGLTHQLAFPTSYLQYAQYLEVRESEPPNRVSPQAVPRGFPVPGDCSRTSGQREADDF